MAIQDIHQWVRSAIAHAGLSQADLAREVAKRMNKGFDRSKINKMATGVRKRITVQEVAAIVEITGYPAPSRDGTLVEVPLISWVSAGQLTDASTQIPVEQLPLLTFADLGRGDFFALRVVGDSMDRLSPDGSTIVINRAERELINGRCYVFSVRGETTFKRWHAEPAYLSPFSTNPTHEPLLIRPRDNLEVVGRVRRTALDL